MENNKKAKFNQVKREDYGLYTVVTRYWFGREVCQYCYKNQPKKKKGKK